MALRKVAQPEDVARQVVVLASDELSGHVTGQVVTVAGGMEGRVRPRRLSERKSGEPGSQAAALDEARPCRRNRFAVSPRQEESVFSNRQLFGKDLEP